MTTESQNPFLQMITPLFQAQQSVMDLFFKNRLSSEAQNVLEEHVQYYSAPSSKESRQKYIRTLRDMGKILEEIIYLRKGDAVLLAVAQERVLSYLLNFLKEIKNIKEGSEQVEVVAKPPEPVPRSVVLGTPDIRRPSRNKNKLTETQQKILDYVRREPNCRTKDVINQFSALSERTIKRGLKELNEEGKIVKRFEGVAVYYSAA
jgi:uncharacterized membrane protein